MFGEQTERKGARYGSLTAVLLLLGLFTIGFVIGTVIWDKGFSADGVVMIAGRADGFAACDSFSGAFRSAVLPIIPFFLVTALCGFFVFGWIAAPLMVFFRAVGFGSAACCLCSAGDAVRAALLIAPDAVVSALLIFEAVTAAVQSRRYLKGDVNGTRVLADYILKTLVFALLLTASAAAQAGVCVLIK